MRYGYWLPVFGGWLRNVDDERMEASWEYNSRLARRSEEIGYDLTLVAELNLNDIKGAEAPSLDAWSTAAALAAVTKKLELMVAVRPTFHQPALLAKQAANIDHIGGGGRLSLNVVSSWWADEAKKYGVHFEQHDDRYARTTEWLEIVERLWQQDHFSFSGKHYSVDDAVMQPKPITRPRPVIYAGGESEAAHGSARSHGRHAPHLCGLEGDAEGDGRPDRRRRYLSSAPSALRRDPRRSGGGEAHPLREADVHVIG